MSFSPFTAYIFSTFHCIFLPLSSLIFTDTHRRKNLRESHQSLNPVRLLHLLPELLEAGLQALMEGPQSLRHLLTMDTHAICQVRDLMGERER